MFTFRSKLLGLLTGKIQWQKFILRLEILRLENAKTECSPLCQFQLFHFKILHCEVFLNPKSGFTLVLVHSFNPFPRNSLTRTFYVLKIKISQTSLCFDDNRMVKGQCRRGSVETELLFFFHHMLMVLI